MSTLIEDIEVEAMGSDPYEMQIEAWALEQQGIKDSIANEIAPVAAINPFTERF